MKRTSMIVVLLALMLLGVLASAGQERRERTFPPSEPARYAATLTMEGPFNVIQMEAIFAPGEEVPMHSHSGPELLAIQEGELTVRLEDGGSETVYRTGETVSLPAGTVFQVFNATDAPTRLLVTLMVPEGQPVTIPRQ